EQNAFAPNDLGVAPKTPLLCAHESPAEFGFRTDARLGNTCHESGPSQEALRHEPQPSDPFAGRHRLPAFLGCRHPPRHVIMLRSRTLTWRTAVCRSPVLS